MQQKHTICEVQLAVRLVTVTAVIFTVILWQPVTRPEQVQLSLSLLKAKMVDNYAIESNYLLLGSLGTLRNQVLDVFVSAQSNVIDHVQRGMPDTEPICPKLSVCVCQWFCSCMRL